MLGTSGNNSPTNVANRPAATTYYRLAIAAGKNRTFTYPGLGLVPTRTLERTEESTTSSTWRKTGKQRPWQPQHSYKGSLASLYISTYNTGFFKCCTAVYIVPVEDSHSTGTSPFLLVCLLERRYFATLKALHTGRCSRPAQTSAN